MYKNNVEFSQRAIRCVGNGKKTRYSAVYIDQSPVLTSNKNKYGWPMSDIQLLIDASDSIQQQNILNRLQMMQANENEQFAKLPDSVKLRLLKPSFVQSPSEVAKFADFCKQFEPELARVLGVEFAKEVIAEEASVDVASVDDGSLSSKE